MKRATYPRYKSSGVEWLGDVPEHWISVTLGRISKRYAGGTPDRNNDPYWEEGTIPWINSGAVNQGLITEPSAFISEEGYRNSSTRWVPKGALVMALAGQGRTKAMVAQTALATTCNQSMAAICPSNMVWPRYLLWLLTAQYNQIRNMAGGEARDGLNLEILGSIPCLLPSSAEQRAIVGFLDRETSRLDQLIAKKRELIERLKEKRTALISRTVTRGLPVRGTQTGLPADAAAKAGLPVDPRLKPSGLDWLGDIPKHWEVKRLRFVAGIQTGNTPSKSDEDNYSDEGLMWVKPDDLSAFKPITETKEYLTEIGVKLCRSIPAGSPLVCCIGTVGKFGFARQEVATNQQINAVIFRQDKVALAFGLYLIAATESEHLSRANNNVVSILNTTQQSNIAVPVPPLPEQAAIGAHLDAETAKLDALAGKVEAAVERLQEYRTALITAAVTGKIDVRQN